MIWKSYSTNSFILISVYIFVVTLQHIPYGMTTEDVRYFGELLCIIFS